MIQIILLLIFLIILSAIFSGIEIAFFSVSELKIKHLVDKKKKNSELLLKLRTNPQRLLITILILNNLVNIGASSIASVFANNLFGSAGVGIAIGAMTFLILVFGEITPKVVAQANAEKISLIISPTISFFQSILLPAIIVFEYLTNFVSKHFTHGKKFKPQITEDELKHFVKQSTQEGSIKQLEQEMINNIFEFDDIEAQEIMTPRTDIYALKENLTIQEALPRIIECGFSRIPVYKESIDKLTGVLYVKDLFEHISKGNLSKPVKELVRKPYYVPETKKIDTLFQQFKKRKYHVAIVVDEYGGIAGLITMEDLLEEIVGEIYDETDEEEPLVNKISENVYEVTGDTRLDDLHDEIGFVYDEEEDFETLNGLILDRLGYIPKKDDILEQKQFKITVKEVSDKEVLKVLLKTNSK